MTKKDEYISVGNGIRASETCTVCGNSLHTVSYLYLTFADLRSFGARFAYKEMKMVPGIQIWREMKNAKVFCTFLQYCISRTTFGFTVVE